ncbi:lipoprotein signal peptidase [Ureaplasma sp. ES3154-GEN]|uniref:lipoprotein signal peptidase n=1 Tax=Ureaplasma sp. ES3154-GEN TaxID=2984844 RepID=UPI0021E7EB26|nr:lipoprotein signal peptidase [Ureaplasma sp. ES3154-GEN]MCV3743703.1 lipoprotein signal peptidase [Ureaplasma sp. ES3154-GEN]
MQIKNNSFTKIHTKLKSIVLFSKQINKIKKTSVRKYFSKLLRLDRLIYKLIAFLSISFIVFLSGFLVRDHYINHLLTINEVNQNNQLSSGLYEFTINNGLGLGQLSNQSHHLVFFVQSIPVVLGFIALFFLVNPVYYIAVMFIIFGTLGNIIDRSITEPHELLQLYPKVFTDQKNGGGNDIYYGVVDYWRFAHSIINLFDVFIVVSVSLLVVYLLSNIIIGFVKTKKDNTDEKIKEHRETNDTTELAKDEDLEVTDVDKKPYGWDEKDFNDKK